MLCASSSRLPDVVGSVVSGDWLNFARSLGRHLPDKRGSIQSFHVRPSRSWAIHTIGVSLLESAALFVFAVVGRYGVSLRDLPLVELGTVISFILLGCVTCELVAGATFLWEGFTENGLECLARAPSLLSLAAGAFWETHLLGFGWIAVLLDLALNFTVIHQVYGSARNTIPFPVLGTGLLIIMLLLYCLFWNTKRLGRQQVRNDEVMQRCTFPHNPQAPPWNDETINAAINGPPLALHISGPVQTRLLTWG